MAIELSDSLRSAGWREAPDASTLGRVKRKYGFAWQVSRVHPVDQEVCEMKLLTSSNAAQLLFYGAWAWRPVDLRTGNYCEPTIQGAMK